MPTGYTSILKDEVSFRQFTLTCARAFGSFIALRDDGLSVLPDLTEGAYDNTYYQDELKRVLEEGGPDTSIETFRRSIADEITSLEISKKEAMDLKDRYNQMLKKVNNWDVPGELQPLKSFMAEQISNSIDFDCDTDYCDTQLEKYGSMDWDTWRKEQLRKHAWDVEYFTEHAEKEKEQNLKRREWIAALAKHLENE